MRHNKKFNHLSRKKAHRDSLLANMTCSLILHKRIFTTLAKAKALRIYAEPLINRSKEANNQTVDEKNSNYRIVFKYLQNKQAVTELFTVVGPKIGDRQGGYTRILKVGHRQGDNASICFIELVDFNEAMLEGKEKKQSRTRRSRRSGKKNAEQQPAAQEQAPAAEE